MSDCELERGVCQPLLACPMTHVNLALSCHPRCRLCRRAPLAVGPGHHVTGNLRFEANESRGYNVHMTVVNSNTGVTHTNTVVTQCALHHFQFTTAQQQQPQPVYYQQPAAAVPSAATDTPMAGDISEC